MAVVQKPGAVPELVPEEGFPLLPHCQHTWSVLARPRERQDGPPLGRIKLLGLRPFFMKFCINKMCPCDQCALKIKGFLSVDSSCHMERHSCV